MGAEMTKDEALKLALETLENNRQTHNYCEDAWYSCPKHEDGCANESEGDECNCGADEANAEIDKAITAIKEALAQPEQESDDLTIAYMSGLHDGKNKYAPQRKLDQEFFVVKHYSADERPTIKGNGFDGLEVGTNREDAEEFIKWVNSHISTPPQRTWVGLDDEHMKELRDANFDLLYGARWAERKLREKNGG